MDWDEAAQLAVDWMDESCTRDDGGPIVVKNVADAGQFIVSLERYQDRWGSTTRRTQDRPGPGPVLAYVPDIAHLQYAMRLARGFPLCVVEGTLTPLSGWAQELNAVNLLEPDAEAPELPEAARKHLERLATYGNNGWGDRFGKQQALRILPSLDEYGLLDDTLEARMLALGASDNGVKNLRKLVDKMRR